MHISSSSFLTYDPIDNGFLQNCITYRNIPPCVTDTRGSYNCDNGTPRHEWPSTTHAYCRHRLVWSVMGQIGYQGYKWNECCFRPRFCSVRLYWADHEARLKGGPGGGGGGDGRANIRCAQILSIKFSHKMLRFLIILILDIKVFTNAKGGIRSSVVANWTAGQQVERSILHQGHMTHNKIHLIGPGCPLPSLTL